MGSCLQPHYHPNGALYIGLSGRTFYGQDYDDFDAWIDGGDVRWVRPGRYYGPEYTNDGCEVNYTFTAILKKEKTCNQAD